MDQMSRGQFWKLCKKSQELEIRSYFLNDYKLFILRNSGKYTKIELNESILKNPECWVAEHPFYISLISKKSTKQFHFDTKEEAKEFYSKLRPYCILTGFPEFYKVTKELGYKNMGPDFEGFNLKTSLPCIVKAVSKTKLENQPELLVMRF
jgi:hypothetical protein